MKKNLKSCHKHKAQCILFRKGETVIEPAINESIDLKLAGPNLILICILTLSNNLLGYLT